MFVAKLIPFVVFVLLAWLVIRWAKHAWRKAERDSLMEKVENKKQEIEITEEVAAKTEKINVSSFKSARTKVRNFLKL